MRGVDLHLSYIPALAMRHKCEITRNILRQKKTTEAEATELSTQLQPLISLTDLKKVGSSEFHESAGGSGKTSVCAVIIPESCKESEIENPD